MTTHNAHRSVAAPPKRPTPPPAPPAPPWDAMFLSVSTQEAMERLQAAPATSEQARMSHRLPAGHFEALPQVVQLTATGEGTQVVLAALTITGAIWACRPFSGDPAWRRLPDLPLEATEAAQGAAEGL